MGWARVNFNYFIDPKEADFVRQAIMQIANDGWKLLPLYHQNPLTGQYVHRSFKAHNTLRRLSELEFGVGSARYRTPCQDRKAPTFEAVLMQAKDIYSAVENAFVTKPLDFEPPASPELLSVLWWPTASDATRLLHREKARKGVLGDLDLREEELDVREHELKRRELKLAATFKTLHLGRGMDLRYTTKKMESQTPPRVKYACFPALSALFPRR